ncbi:MAG: hypothetical protein P9X22_08790 [Candidatus Zapsychrus exili]|nr:hypothetical protein [Candidatus Zapsychrus exili]
MMQENLEKYFKKIIVLLLCIIFAFGFVKYACADVTINILTVNGTEKLKETNIKYYLPIGLKSENVLDTSGLKLDYDVNEERYMVQGEVSLSAKETKTFKVRLKDTWQVDTGEIDGIKKQINESLGLIADTEYYEIGKIRKESLLQRLDSIIEQQEDNSENVEERIGRYSIYSQEIENIRSDAFSIDYWRSKPPDFQEANVLNFIIDINNPTKDTINTADRKHYLPAEVKPEHIVNAEGFSVRYDAGKGKSYLSREEDLLPSETKRYKIEVVDVWSILQTDIDDIKFRTGHAYKLLKTTEYANSADFLVTSIKENVKKIEESQTQEKKIEEHIGAYRTNKKLFDTVKKDVVVLENLLRAVREYFERSSLKNVLQKITLLNTIAAIAAAMFGEKPLMSTVWKIIYGIMAFVAIFTIINFVVWGKRSKNLKEEELEEPEDEKEKTT